MGSAGLLPVGKLSEHVEGLVRRHHLGAGGRRRTFVFQMDTYDVTAPQRLFSKTDSSMTEGRTWGLSSYKEGLPS